jgi:hypothetical protein
MLSSKMVRLIEDHWDSLTTRIVKEIRGDLRLTHVSSLEPSELRERASDILEHLGHWLTLSSELELTRHFERIGAEHRGETIPLHEVVLAYSIIKNQMIDFVRAQGIGTTMDLYAEEELELCVGRFFDTAIYRVVRGYELAAPPTRLRAAGMP